MLEATKLSQEEGEVDDQRRVQFSPDPSKLADGTCRFGFKGRKQRKEDGRRWRKCRGSLRRKEMRRKKKLPAHMSQQRLGLGTRRRERDREIVGRQRSNCSWLRRLVLKPGYACGIVGPEMPSRSPWSQSCEQWSYEENSWAACGLLLHLLTVASAEEAAAGRGRWCKDLGCRRNSREGEKDRSPKKEVEKPTENRDLLR
ncbi:hypothetical protein BHM03_00037593 [Ensete ventricosum]|nr:hypothetical protein BHM03_00037593 [Ensete ventricosum]